MCQQQSVFPHSSKSYHKKIWSRHLLLCSGNPEICVLLPCLASISHFPLYLTVSIFCHSLALLITIADCLLNLKLTSLYHSNFHTVRWKLSGRTGLQDKMEVSEWTKIKSNFSRKKKRKKNSSPPSYQLPMPIFRKSHLYIYGISKPGTQQEGKERRSVHYSLASELENTPLALFSTFKATTHFIA